MLKARGAIHVRRVRVEQASDKFMKNKNNSHNEQKNNSKSSNLYRIYGHVDELMKNDTTAAVFSKKTKRTVLVPANLKCVDVVCEEGKLEFGKKEVNGKLKKGDDIIILACDLGSSQELKCWAPVSAWDAAYTRYLAIYRIMKPARGNERPQVVVMGVVDDILNKVVLKGKELTPDLIWSELCDDGSYRTINPREILNIIGAETDSAQRASSKAPNIRVMPRSSEGQSAAA